MILSLAAVSLSLLLIAMGYVFDLRKIRRVMYDILDGELRQPKLFTSLGRDILDSLLMFHTRRLGISAPTELSSGEGVQAGVDHELFSEILRRHTQNVGATYSAVIGHIEGVSDGSHQVIVAKGVGGERFFKVVDSIYGRFLDHGDTSVFGVRDGLGGEAILGDFSLFGVQYSLSLPLELSGSKDRAFLWFGFPSERYPSKVDVEKARLCARDICREVISYRERTVLQQKASTAELLAEERSEFMAHASHDLRSPLQNVKAILSLVSIEGVKDDTPHLIGVALRNCDTMVEIVDTVLEYSRYQAGDLKAKKCLVDLNNIANRIHTANSFTAEQKGLDFRVENASGNAYVTADPHHLHRVISNLVDNAIKFTSTGSVIVSIEGASKDSWLVKVRDTGPGVSKDLHELIFVPFYRATGNSVKGVGLGLSLAKVLTEMNDGKIRVESLPGVGSVFSLEFPRATQEIRPDDSRSESAEFEKLVA